MRAKRIPSTRPPAKEISVKRSVFFSAIVTISGNWSRAMSRRKNWLEFRSQSASRATAASAAKNRTYIPARVSRRRVVRRMGLAGVDGEVGVVDLLVGAVVAQTLERGVDRVDELGGGVLGHGVAVLLVGRVLLDDDVARVRLGVLDVDGQVLEDRVDLAGLDRRPQLGVARVLHECGALGVLLGVGQTGRPGLDADVLAREVGDGVDARVRRHEQ